MSCVFGKQLEPPYLFNLLVTFLLLLQVYFAEFLRKSSLFSFLFLSFLCRFWLGFYNPFLDFFIIFLIIFTSYLEAPFSKQFYFSLKPLGLAWRFLTFLSLLKSAFSLLYYPFLYLYNFSFSLECYLLPFLSIQLSVVSLDPYIFRIFFLSFYCCFYAFFNN